MDSTVESIVRLTLCGVDVFMAYSFFDSMFIQRVKKTYLFIFLGIAAVSMWGINFFKNPWVNILAIPFCYYFFIKSVFKVSLQKSILYTAIYFIIFACGRELAFEMLYRLLEKAYPETSQNIFSPDGIIFLIVEVLFSFCFLLYIEKYTRKLEGVGEIKGDWYLLIMPVTSILVLFCFAYVDFPNEKIMQILFCIGAFLLYFSNGIVFVILANYTISMNKIKLSELSMLKRDLDSANFENMQKVNDAYRKYMHDIHHYFYQIRNLAYDGENQVIIDIVDKVEGQIKSETESRMYVANTVLNSIFVVCSQKAEEYGVELSVSVKENIDMNFIEDADMISMFGNVLDNAIDAAAKCEVEKRKAEVRLFMANKHIVYFDVRNTWDGVLKKDGQKVLSSKKDSINHGLGISIIKNLANKYGGYFEIQEEGEWFTAALCLSRDIR